MTVKIEIDRDFIHVGKVVGLAIFSLSLAAASATSRDDGGGVLLLMLDVILDSGSGTCDFFISVAIKTN